MRPAVHASILRNRTQRVRRVNRPHSFSMRRLLVLAFIGALFFIPGIVMTIVGLELSPGDLENLDPGRRITYQVIGPALTSLGIGFLFSACVYYYCYGSGESNRLPRGAHQKKYLQSSINSDHSHHHHGHGHHGHGHHGHGHHGHHGHHRHHNGSQLNTPEGSIRRLSFTERVSPQPTHIIHQNEEEQVPLAATPQDVCGSPRSPPAVAIRVDRAPEAENEEDVQERELLVNGGVPSGGDAPVV